MFLERIYDESLAQAAYVVACDHTRLAVVIDANRDVDACLRVAEHHGFQIIAATETHIHADFVSGTRELARRTGARLHLSCEGGPGWQYGFATPGTTTLLRHDRHCNVPLLRRAERLPCPRAAWARIHLSLRTRGHDQAHVTASM